MRPTPFHLAACLLLALPVTASAQRLLHWNGAGAQAPVQQVDPRWLQLESTGAGFTAWIHNPLPGPAQIRLRAEGARGYESVPALPTQAVLGSGERRAVSHLYRIDPQAPALGLAVDAVPGDPGALPDGQVYRLPFEGAPVRIDQGYGGAFSHRDPPNRYALDFALPEGTPVLAAREGTVLQVEGAFGQAAVAGERTAGPANLVRVLHRDGTMAVYAHLSPTGISVRPGQWVKAGQRLALSGQTGLSTAPHLHFALQVNAGLRLAAIPFRMAGPLGELRFPQEGAAAAGAAEPGAAAVAPAPL